MEIGDPDTMEGCRLIPPDRWKELSDYLRSYELPAWKTSQPDLLDETRSSITITWREGSELARYCHDGIGAWEVREILQKLSEELCQSTKSA